jgi:ABC-type multidrug transport system fused ATPase/permease subunit
MLIFDKRRIKVGGFIEMAIYTLSVAFQVSAYILIGINAFNGNISIGDFTMGIASLINFMSASSFVATNILNFNDGMFYIRRYKSFLKLRSKFDTTSDITIDDIDLDNIEIEFRNVWFRYPNSTAFVLKNINLTIKNKEKLAIAGFNGAGKTSLMLLLTRMYDPTEGHISLNGIDIRKINYRDYQKIFSTVNQDFSLLAFSLLENIAKTDTVTQEEKNTITELFNNNRMGERLEKLYRKLDTPVTKTLEASGVDLSGGERQKVAIIRALYKDSPVLILDEPTSALDPVTEYEIYQKFAEMSEEKLTIYISHRIYSTRFCDKIAVFDKGEMIEYGTFDELMELKGLYYDFFQKQAEYFK